MNLKNKTALVTGSSSGIGEAIALALADKGAKIVVNARKNVKGGKSVVEKIKKFGGEAIFVQADVAEPGDVKKLFKEIVKEYKTVDILVNNAGVNRPRGLFKVEDWKEVFRLDLFSVVLVTGEVVKKAGGKILNVTSIYGDGKACYKGIAPYGAAKAALNHYTQMLSKNLAPKILVNAIAPGYVKTPLWGSTSDEEFEESGKEQLIERMIEPEEIAHMAVAIIEMMP